MTSPAAAGGSTKQAERPLNGIVVVDLTRFHPGGYVTRILCDLGAEVVKVEPPGGSPMRRAGASIDYSWVTLHHSMKSMTLDLRHERAAEVMAALATIADVVVESHPHGRLDAAGIGYEQLGSLNPGLVWCSLSAWGRLGPRADEGGHELTFLAHSGVLDLITPAGVTPSQPPLMIAASQGGLWGAIGVLAALEQRHRTGRGQLVDASIVDATMWLASQEVTRSRQGADPWPASTPGRNAYLCSDGRWVAVAALEPRTWRSLCEGLGLGDIAESVEGRPLPPDEVASRVAAAFATRPARHWIENIVDANLAIVHTVDELADDPHFRSRGSIVEIRDETVTNTVVAPPIRFVDPEDGDHRADEPSAPPALADASEAILARAGLSGARLGELRESGVLG